MKSWWIIIVALFLAGWVHAAEGLQPYLLLEETRGNSRVNLTELKEGLEKEGFWSWGVMNLQKIPGENY